MRRNKTLKHGRQGRRPVVRIRLVHALAAGGLSYLLGGWHTTALYSTEPSAAETVALRFPEISDNTATIALSAQIAAAATRPTADKAELALLNPEPMAPQVEIPTATPEALHTDQQRPIETAAIDAAASAAPAVAAAPTKLPAAPARLAVANSPRQTKPAAPAPRYSIANRPGYMLNDAQIASIKARLNLTPDQEEMWPSVELALRNMTYMRGQPARERDASDTAGAALDPDAVQGLKSAAVPLIMSFNAEQKDEVRSLVHVMGLDQLATQF